MPRGKSNRGWAVESAVRATVLTFALAGFVGCNTWETDLISLPAGVLLRIENRTGLPLEAEASYVSAEQSVRLTTRTLDASGPEAVESILATQATVVTVTVRVGEGVGPPARVSPGDVLREETYLEGVDYVAGDQIVLIITLPDAPVPDPIVDCNENGVSDSLDIADGTSTDCDGDGQPDECQSLEDVDDNGIPDICEFWCDLNGDEVVDSADVLLFVAILLDTPEVYGGDPTGPSGSGTGSGQDYEDGLLIRADFNGDGRVDGDDTQGFLECVLESSL